MNIVINSSSPFAIGEAGACDQRYWNTFVSINQVAPYLQISESAPCLHYVWKLKSLIIIANVIWFF